MNADTLATAIGVISGTSMDGIDVALIRSDAETRVEALETVRGYENARHAA